MPVLDGSSDEDGKTDVINPTDSETLGTIVVLPPDGFSTLPSGTGSLAFRGTALVLNEPKRFTAGTGCLAFNGFSGTQQNCDIAIRAGERTTVKLSILALAATGDALDVDVGHTAYPIKITTDGWSGTQTWSPVILSGPATSARNLFVLPGAYKVQYSTTVLPDLRVSVAEGATQALNVVPAVDPRARIKVTGEAVTFATPAGPGGGCTNINRMFVVHTSLPVSSGDLGPSVSAGQASVGGSSPYIPWRKLDLTAPTAGPATQTLRAFPAIGAASFALAVNGASLPITTTAGTTTEIFVPRIDVNSVAVTTESGAVAMAPATYRIDSDIDGVYRPIQIRRSYYSDCSGSDTTIDFAGTSPSGVYLLRGTYRVNIAYSTSEGARTQVFHVNLTD